MPVKRSCTHLIRGRTEVGRSHACTTSGFMSTAAGCRGDNAAQERFRQESKLGLFRRLLELECGQSQRGTEEIYLLSGSGSAEQGSCQGTRPEKRTLGEHRREEVLAPPVSSGSLGRKYGMLAARLPTFDMAPQSKSSWVPASRAPRGRSRRPRDLLRQYQQGSASRMQPPAAGASL